MSRSHVNGSAATTTRRLLMRILALVLGLVLGIVGGGAGLRFVHAHATRLSLQDDVDALLRYGTPGVLVGLQTRINEIEVRSGVGNRETRASMPWNAKFRIGSFTKTFVAATVLQLVGEGALGLDDTVSSFLPDVLADGDKITVRSLLQQTSGLPEYLREVDYVSSGDESLFLANRNETVTAELAVEIATLMPRDFDPGTSWGYSNTNYAVAGLIIEVVTGHTWQHEVNERILRPLGLHDTTAPDTDPTIPQPHANAYERFAGVGATEDDPKYGDFVDVTEYNPSWAGAAAEMISTTSDSNTFLRALLSGKVLPPAQLREMLTTVDTNEAFRVNWPGGRYGLGIMYVPTSCGGSWFHGGDVIGSRTRGGVSADGSKSIVVSFNTSSLQPADGVPAPAHDPTADLIDDALCGTD
uniref:serine hydrolase domain-containing protein n=1 Tax=Paractinoplanes polyasparticus TaxID=2856853 RepID=UPI0021074251|nr:serine hydrolase domain-containing protein [Actinoplanes polyasparticus]